MPGLDCKSVVCSAACLNSMITPELEEIVTHGAIPLAANGLMRDDQLTDLIAIFTEFQESSYTHAEQKKFELEAAEQVKEILLRYVNL